MSVRHITVMGREVTALLTREGTRGGRLVDVTLGEGGHAEALLRQRDDVQVLGIDQDAAAIEASLGRLRVFGDRFQAVCANFREMAEIQILVDEQAQGVVMDLGVSSRQLDLPERGFSFQQDGPLDMRMDQRRELTAAEVVNRWDEEKLAGIFWELGEERCSRRIARRLVEVRKTHAIRTTGELAELVARAGVRPTGGRHPATRVFRALRMAVNDELGTLEMGLDAAWKCLAVGGRLAVITFQSLEDRIVKRRFREWVREDETRNAERGVLLNKKPREPGAEEIFSNPRARSAKLRAIEKTKVEGRRMKDEEGKTEDRG